MADKSQLRINLDYEALVRLLGGTETVVVELRQTIVEEFATRHLKALANAEGLATVMSRLVAVVQERVDAFERGYLEKLSGYGTNYKSTEKLRALIDTGVSGNLATRLKQEVSEAVAARAAVWQADIERSVKSYVDATFRDLVAVEVNKRIKAALEGKL